LPGIDRARARRRTRAPSPWATSVDAVHRPPVVDLELQELPALDELLDRARAGAGRQALAGVDLGVEQERPGTEERLGVDDPARLLVDRQACRVRGRARPE